MNKIIAAISIIFLIVVLYIGYDFYRQVNKDDIPQDNDQPEVITSFDECVAQGYPVMESYPPQCRTDDGQTFTQDIGNELEVADEIQVSNPRPYQPILSPLTIEGKAVGSWLFEGNTDYILYDPDGNIASHGLITAQDDWMTSEMVPFKGLVVFSQEGYPGPGRLVINKSNPSGLEENAQQLVIPVYFQ